MAILMSSGLCFFKGYGDVVIELMINDMVMVMVMVMVVVMAIVRL